VYDVKKAAAADWQTPTAMNANGNGYQRQKDGSVIATLTGQTGAASMPANWGTPRVTTNGGHPSPQCTGKGSRLEDQAAVEQQSIATPASCFAGNLPSPESSEPSDTTASAMWPTPNATDIKGASQPAGRRPACDDDLPSRVAANWPSPQSNDDKNLGQCTPGHQPQLRHVPQLLAGQAAPENPNTPGKPRGSLNSAWVMQLMGFPDEYAAELTRLLCEWSATPGATPSRK
jgi:hypothetical protein